MLSSQPISFFTVPSSFPAATGFRTGQTFQTLVQGTAQDSFLLLGGVRIPLNAAALVPGQTVDVEVLSVAEGLQLRVEPTAPGALPAPVPVPAAPSLDQVVATVLQSLGAPGNIDDAVRVVPRLVPETSAAVRQLLALFVSRGSLNADLQDLAGLLQLAAGDGALSPQNFGQFSAILGQMAAAESQEFRNLARQMHSDRSLEARLVLALQAGDVQESLRGLQQNLRGLVAELRGREALLTYFQGKGLLQRFEKSARQVLDRLTGVDLQNLRGLEHNYVFWELPFAQDAPIRHAQIHLLDDGHGRKQKFDPRQATIVFDLATTRLGDLWIALQLQPSRCQCSIRSTSETGADALRQAAPELAAALERIGYSNARIQTARWDGDRLRATADLMARFRGISVEA
ncbi:MAG: hypothetical protein HYZ00_09210 [Candidatus Hydrogenedentes bacterium]|nr:hypothetical protein [Candidatus Hydrogenedentota bacterium]